MTPSVNAVAKELRDAGLNVYNNYSVAKIFDGHTDIYIRGFSMKNDSEWAGYLVRIEPKHTDAIVKIKRTYHVQSKDIVNFVSDRLKENLK